MASVEKTSDAVSQKVPFVFHSGGGILVLTSTKLQISVGQQDDDD